MDETGPYRSLVPHSPPVTFSESYRARDGLSASAAIPKASNCDRPRISAAKLIFSGLARRAYYIVGKAWLIHILEWFARRSVPSTTGRLPCPSSSPNSNLHFILRLFLAGINGWKGKPVQPEAKGQKAR